MASRLGFTRAAVDTDEQPAGHASLSIAEPAATGAESSVAQVVCQRPEAQLRVLNPPTQNQQAGSLLEGEVGGSVTLERLIEGGWLLAGGVVLAVHGCLSLSALCAAAYHPKSGETRILRAL